MSDQMFSRRRKEVGVKIMERLKRDIKETRIREYDMEFVVYSVTGDRHRREGSRRPNSTGLGTCRDREGSHCIFRL